MLVGLLTAPYGEKWILKELQINEIKFKLFSSYELRTQQLVVVETTSKDFNRDIYKYQGLRLVEDIFLLITSERSLVRRSDLAKLLPNNFKDKVLNGLTFKFAKKKASNTSTFNVFIKQDADYNLFKKEIATYINSQLLLNFKWWRQEDPALIEFWGFYVLGKFSLGLRLTDIDFRKRRYKIRERSGSLRPTLAARLALIAAPKKSDLILDPMCGVGTILIERALLGEYSELYGGDIDEEAVVLANANFNQVGLEHEVTLWDAANGVEVSEKLLGKKFNKIITNLPFGKKFSTGRSTSSFYLRLLKVWLGLLKSGAELYILTSEIKTLILAVKKIQTDPDSPIASFSTVADFNVQGIEAKVLRIKCF
jgi:tRNA (guanine6-N2)-methyltransferase